MKKITSLLILMLLVVSVAFADKPLQFIFSEDISYDDNIYLTQDDKVSSAISSTQLYAKYLNTIPNTALKLGANANIGYNAYTENPAKNDYMNAGAGFNVGNNKFSLDEKFLYTADPATSELTERAKRINNIASFRFKTSLEKKFSIGFLVSDIFDRYMDNMYKSLNRNRVNAGAQVYYNMSPKTSFYFAYLYSIIKYENNDRNNSNGNSFSLGVNGNVTQKVKGTAQISYDTRNYDEDVEGADSNFGIFGYLLSLTYEPTRRDTIILSGERKVEEATFANNRYYISTGIGLEYKHSFYQKWTLGLLAAYENIGYPETVEDVNRNDDLIKVKPSIEYKFKDYLFASLWYQFRNKSSNFDSVEYTDNKVGLQVKFCF